MNETFSFDYLSLVYDNNKYSLAKLIFFFFFFFFFFVEKFSSRLGK